MTREEAKKHYEIFAGDYFQQRKVVDDNWFIDKVYDDFEEEKDYEKYSSFNDGYIKGKRELESKACETCTSHRNCNIECAFKEAEFCEGEAYEKYVEPFSCSIWKLKDK